MARLIKKCRLCRRERTKLFLKGARCFSPKCPLEKRGAVPPGVHGIKSGVRQSLYAKQLREKQKTKRFYGVSERQLRNYFKVVSKKKGLGKKLLQFLEMRLDNVVYRLGLSPSRATARQLIVHGQVFVNQKKLTIPSYQVKVGDEISLSEKARKMKKIQSWLAKKETTVPEWLKKKGFIGKINNKPKEEDMPSELDEHLIVEFYSR